MIAFRSETNYEMSLRLRAAESALLEAIDTAYDD
jgi:hypothetical protein